MDVIVDVEKGAVLLEVAQTTSYAGAKRESDDDPGAYERLGTTDADGSQLERFWQESRTGLCCRLKRWLLAEGETPGGLRLQMRMPAGFDVVMLEAVERDMFSYFVMSIIGRWFMLCNREEAEGYLTAASGLLEGIVRKIVYKLPPERPEY